ncbi:BTAD domain-containing putative transcriptional regulator [Roseibium sp.]|uniref:BTAD domain-containing putative transcriptional regulator n=1 Tax=Roseibium sp. TaxID=1936156 RepID=UPI003D11AF66
MVKSESGHIQISTGSLPTDLARLLDLLNTSDSPDFDAARGLWRGDYLAGFEDIDPVFTEWLLIERQRIRDEVIDATLKHLSGASTAAATQGAEDAAHFLLHMDPAFEPAHRALIRIYLNSGQRERAEQQLRACERELKELDGEPEQETRDLLSGATKWEPPTNRPESGGGKYTQALQGDDKKPSRTDSIVGDNAFFLPQISIVSTELNNITKTEGLYLREEIVGGLSAYRSFDLYHAEYFGDTDGPQPVLLQSDEAGSFLLRFRHNERSGNVSIQFEDRAEGRIVFSEIVDLNEWDSVQMAASHTIGRIYNFVTKKLRNPKNTSAFARWCQAEALMIEFNPHSDQKALEILNDIERRYSTFSMAYSGKALINLKQLVYYYIENETPTLPLNEILSLAEHAVALDPWQPINQRAFGWALIQSNMADEARRAFIQAGRLNSVDPINIMSVAEGLAFSGSVEEARAKAELAMNLFTTVPRVFYEYYSHVFFAAEDFETAAKMIERASFDSISGLTTRIASLVCAGKQSEAIDLLQRNSDIYTNTFFKNGLIAQGPQRFGNRLNFYNDPKTRANYDRGVDLVKRYFFGDRASIS